MILFISCVNDVNTFSHFQCIFLVSWHIEISWLIPTDWIPKSIWPAQRVDVTWLGMFVLSWGNCHLTFWWYPFSCLIFKVNSFLSLPIILLALLIWKICTYSSNIKIQDCSLPYLIFIPPPTKIVSWFVLLYMQIERTLRLLIHFFITEIITWFSNLLLFTFFFF